MEDCHSTLLPASAPSIPSPSPSTPIHGPTTYSLLMLSKHNGQVFPKANKNLRTVRVPQYVMIIMQL
ncbi:hypothetical protein E2C01_084571 [Portunus trituberculatus]|uniref:Uncharacterized protein n=1 Tax=Portunus trituberculatus TaxID=210409 RepID=A0A5B7J835_PORTR|nr:hypothetical protein [Portunus trituberculatus]